MIAGSHDDKFQMPRLVLSIAGIAVTAYGSLGSGSTDLLTDASVKTIAVECGKTPAQVSFMLSRY